MADNPRIEDLRRRLEKEPHSRLFAQLAEELRKDGDFEEAIRVARHGLSRHPSYPSARMTLGRALFDAGDMAAARVELETVLKGAPDNILASRLLAECLDSLGDREGALARYRATLALSPGDKQITARVLELEGTLRPGVAPTATPPAAAAPGASPPPIPLSQVDRPMELETYERRQVADPTPIPLVEAEQEFELERTYEAPGTQWQPAAEAAAPRPSTVAAPPAQAPEPAPTPAPSPPAPAPGTHVEPEFERSFDYAFDTPGTGATPSLAPEPPRVPSAVEPPPAEPPPAETPTIVPGTQPGPAAGREPAPPTSALEATLADASVPAFEPPRAAPAPPATISEPEPTISEPKPATTGPPSTFSAPSEPSYEPPPPEPPPAVFQRPAPPPASAAAPVPGPAPVEPAAPAAELPAPEPTPVTGPVGGVPAPLPTAAAEAELLSPTLAELYFNQGFPEKALEIYRRLVDREPDNERARSRLAELQALTAGAAPAPGAREGVTAGTGPAAEGRLSEAEQARAARREALERTIKRLESLRAALQKEPR